MGKPKKDDSKPGGAPMWIVTFTDMSSLLLTFFIMLLTFSSMETEKLKQATGNLAGAFGAITDPQQRSRPDLQKQEKVKATALDRNGPTEASLRDEVVDDALKQVQDRRIFDVTIKVEDTVEGARLELEPEPGREFFLLGSDILEEPTTQLLREIAALFKTLPVKLVVETHVDSEVGRLRRSKTPHDLTLDQALAAAGVLIDSGAIAENVAVSPQGDTRPLVPNAREAEDRYKNRRLAILVIPFEKDEIMRRAAGGS